MNNSKKYGKIRGPYEQPSVRERIKALFLDNIGKVITRDQLIKVAKDPKTGENRENRHQRLSELRTDEGYAILSYRDMDWLDVGEYMMPTSEKEIRKKSRVTISEEAWEKVLESANYRCEWKEKDQRCGLKEGDKDPIGGGTVKLTPDHKTPHEMAGKIDPDDPDQWQALCGRHQVMKKHYWNNQTGKLNVYAIVQAAKKEEKLEVYKFLREYFGEE